MGLGFRAVSSGPYLGSSVVTGFFFLMVLRSGGRFRLKVWRSTSLAAESLHANGPSAKEVFY